MKRTTVVIAVLLLAGAWVMAAETGQRPKAVMASGGLYIWLTDAGSATCIGGTPTGTWPPCSPGTKEIIWRHLVGTFTPVNVTGPGAAYLGGVLMSPANCNLDAEYKGHCWGTFVGPGAGAGTWEGVFSGTIDFANFGGDLSFVGHGSGSREMEGLLLKMDSASPGTGNPMDPMPFTARIQKID